MKRGHVPVLEFFFFQSAHADYLWWYLARGIYSSGPTWYQHFFTIVNQCKSSGSWTVNSCRQVPSMSKFFTGYLTQHHHTTAIPGKYGNLGSFGIGNKSVQTVLYTAKLPFRFLFFPHKGDPSLQAINSSLLQVSIFGNMNLKPKTSSILFNVKGVE